MCWPMIETVDLLSVMPGPIWPIFLTSIMTKQVGAITTKSHSPSMLAAIFLHFWHFFCHDLNHPDGIGNEYIENCLRQ